MKIAMRAAVRISACCLLWATRLWAADGLPGATYMPERDILRQLDFAPVIDGALSEWSHHPIRVLGCDSLTEAKITAEYRSGWNETGLVFAIDVSLDEGSRTAARAQDYIDVFIDVRPPDARMERYEAGVSHLRLYPLAKDTGERIVQFTGNGQRLESATLKDCTFAARQTATGWTAEILVPWKILGDYRPARGDWIGVSTRIVVRDSSSAREFSVGARDTDPKNTLETTPIAFSPVVLGDSTAIDLPIDYRAEEVIWGGEAWLEAEAIVPARIMSPARSALLQVEVSGTTENVPFVGTISGRFFTARFRMKLEPGVVTADKVHLALTIPQLHWHREDSVTVPAFTRFERIERELPKDKIASLATDERALVEVLKACAQEIATLLCPAPDGARPPRKRFRPVLQPTVYDSRFRLFLDTAGEFLAGKKLAPDFPFRGWQSKVDGVWLPIRISYPWNFQTGRLYPARMFIFGFNQHRSRTEFLESTLRAYRTGQYFPFFGDWFSLVPFERTNGIDDLDGEALQHLTSCFKSLPIDPARVSVHGGSGGAAVALQLALHHPDEFSAVCARAGTFDGVLPPAHAEAVQLLRNLTYTPVYLVCGDSDGKVTTSTHQTVSLLEQAHVDIQFEELKNMGHYFSPPETPVEIAQHRTPGWPTRVTIATFSPDHGKAYWLCIDEILRWGALAQVEGRVDGDRVVLTTRNVRRFTVDLSAAPAAINIGRLIIDNDELGIPLLTRPKRMTFVRRSSGADWRMETSSDRAQSPQISKCAGLSGPIERIARRKIVIVYGSTDASLAPYLRDRGFRVLADRIGLGVRQSCVGDIAIVRDAEFDPQRYADCNLWLIGNDRENRVTREIMQRMPDVARSGKVLLAEAVRNGNEALLSFIHPLSADSDHYVYLEIGSAKRAYLAEPMPVTTSDISLQILDPNGAILTRMADFDSDWRPPETLQ